MKTFDKNTTPQDDGAKPNDQSRSSESQSTKNTPDSTENSGDKTEQPGKQRPEETGKKPGENPDHTSPEKSKGPYAENTGNTNNPASNKNVDSNPVTEEKGNNKTDATFKPGFTDFNQTTKDSRSGNQDVDKGDTGNSSPDAQTSKNDATAINSDSKV